MSKPKVLVTKRVYPEAVALLEQSCHVDYVNSDDGLATPQLLARAADCDAIVSQLTDKLDAQVIAALPASVRVIANVAVGYDNIDIPAATARGILATNTPGVLTETTADFAFALLMAAGRRIVEGHQFVHDGKWRTWLIDLLAGQDIHHKTLGIFGMGRIGQAMARRARGFDMTILYNDAQPLRPELEQELGLRFVSKDHLLQHSDYVSLHVPFTPDTHHMIGAAELALMKPTAILINTARGAVVDEAALADALERRVIAAAGLDVFEKEPNVHPKLLELPNVTVAPHIASASVDTRRRMSLMAAENALAALHGERPANLLNPDAWRG